jgi:hypothetical protein
VALEWIAIEHADGTMARVTREAYDTLYKSIGWNAVDEQKLIDRESLAAAAAFTAADPTKMSKDELVALAAAKGVQLDGTETKAEIAEKLQGS